MDQPTAQEAVQQRGSFNLIHLESMVKVDVFLPEERAFAAQEQARARPQTLDVADGARSFLVKSPEDVVLRKLDWYRAGGQVSERQWRDVLGVLRVQADRLDEDYIRRWAAVLGLSDLLARALAEAQAD